MSNNSLTIFLAQDSDQKKWDQYANAHPESSPYHLFAWKRAVEEAYGHKAMYWYAEENEQIVGVFPLIHFRIPLLLSELNSLPFCDVGNMLCNDEEVGQALFKEASRLLEEKSIKRMHLRGTLLSPIRQENKLIAEKHDKVRMLMELPENSDLLMQSFKSKLRSQIRKAEKNGLEFTWGSTADLDEYYDVFSENMRDLGSPVHSKKWFRSLLTHFGEDVRMGLVKYGQKTVGGCLLLTAGHKIAIPWASTLRKYNKLAPNMLLYWNVLKYSADAGFSIFDFGRSSLGEGTFKFKKQWGAAPYPLNWYTYDKANSNSSSAEKSTGKTRKEQLAAAWMKLPKPVANFMGPKIRKYISL